MAVVATDLPAAEHGLERLLGDAASEPVACPSCGGTLRSWTGAECVYCDGTGRKDRIDALHYLIANGRIACKWHGR